MIDNRLRRELLELARACLARYLTTRPARRATTPASAFAVSEAEAEAAVRPVTGPDAADAEGTVAHHARAGERVDDALAAVMASTNDPREPRLGRLVRVCSLASLDVQVIAVLLAPEIDDELERAYSYAIDDFTRKRPDVRFVARVIGAADDGLVDRVLDRFDETAPLRRSGIVTLAAGDVPAPLRTARLADRVVAFLRGSDALDELVRGHVRLGRESVTRDQVVMKRELVQQIARTFDGIRPPRILLAGPEGVGRGLVIEALMAEVGRAVIRIDLASIVADGQIGERIAAALREAALRDATVIFDGTALPATDTPRALIQPVITGVDGLSIPVVFTFEDHPPWLVRGIPDLVEIDVPAPTFRERLQLWQRALPGIEDPADLETVASRYRFTGATIAHAARRAMSCAQLRDGDTPRISLDDLGDAARLMFSQRLGTMAQRIPTGFAWSDLVLPSETLDALREIVTFAHYKPFLLEDWGFAAKLPYGRGVSAILAGPPGTGKTMVAQLLAKEIGFDLYRIDISQVVNKYIGETEKNLARIFDEAEHSHAVLFFDEADSLFAKRTNVQSSNDRYANLEVNYLLQRMETFDGVTLLATNLEQGLDEAFKRRVRFTVQFELPGEVERTALWRSMFPPKVPLATDIDWKMIGAKFEMAGGYIKKAALRAALIAAETRRPVTTDDLLTAARHEYREMGRIV
ncbi:MAG: AAA family ATPase [Deltaproteobacteria bacterium]|nr:AAA family ATPase [Deltaproteobacteria bacterium]